MAVRISLRCESRIMWHIILLQHEASLVTLIAPDSRKMRCTTLALIHCATIHDSVGSGLLGYHCFLIFNLSQVSILIVLRHDIMKFLLVHI